MKRTRTNLNNLSLSVAVPLIFDGYDHNSNPKEISATSLLKPVKELVLQNRILEDSIDISTLTDSFIGTSVHNAVEDIWINHHKEALTQLGYSDDFIKKILINPDKTLLENSPNAIPIYLEQRVKKEINGYVISGKYDLVIDGVVEDIKTTKSYTYIKKTNDKKYQLQGSIYKWLNPDIITADHMLIQYFFTDWKEYEVFKNKDYPPARQLAYKIPLLTISETEAYIVNKLAQLDKYKDSPECDIPRCTDEELWKNPSKWKYYSDPTKTTRATKVSDNYHELLTLKTKNNNIGAIVEFPGKAKYCDYCTAKSICEQRKEYL